PANGISLDCYLIIARPAFEKSFHKAANEKIVGSADDARNGLRQKAILGCAGVWAQRISRILRYGSLLSVAFTSFLTPGVMLIRRSAGGCFIVTTLMMLADAFSAAAWRSRSSFARLCQSASGARPLSIASMASRPIPASAAISAEIGSAASSFGFPFATAA